ncbi:hypothetical protein JCM5296_004908 [Sporobolomyces johnsonii]
MAYGYTSLLSRLLFDAWATPARMFFVFFLVKARYHWVVGMMSLVGTFASLPLRPDDAQQGAGLEHHFFHTDTWNGTTVGLLIGYTCAMLFLYTLASILSRLSSSSFYNLSHRLPNRRLVGLVVYFCAARPESLEINVVARGKQAQLEALNGRKVIGESSG